MRESVTISGLGSLGEGVGTLSSGLKVFVEGALPSEQVEVDLLTQKKNYAKGKLSTLVQASPDRIDPICPLFGLCGGCHLMHLSYSKQLEVKQQKVQEALSRLGKQTITVDPCRPSEMPLYYRNKIQLPVQGQLIGLYRKKSHEVIDVEHCYIHNKQGGLIYDWIRRNLPYRQSIKYILLKTAVQTNQTLLILVTDGQANFTHFASCLREQFTSVIGVIENLNPSSTNTILSTHFKTLAGATYLTESLLNKQFKIGPGSFFQVNPWQAEKLVETVLQLAQIEPKDIVYDAYTGVGMFAIFAAENAKKVIGTESNAEAIYYAKQNALLNKLTNCEFKVANASFVKEATLTILNPPRKGCDSQVLQNLTSKQVIYISCDPATLARDIALLKNYRLEQVIPFDLFPQTVHVETVAKLTRIK